VTETIVVCVGLYVAWKILSAVNEPGKPQQFASTAASAPVPSRQEPIGPPLPAAPSTSTLQSLRKRLAADEKLTPELKAAFDLIQAALEEK